MNETTTAPAIGQLPRRDFLRNAALLAVPLTLGSVAMPASAALFVPLSRTRGTTVLSVASFGAVGDGTTDDTAAFQRAINALPATGGTVTVPAGTYLIDPVKSVRLRSQMALVMAPDATLLTKTNSAEKAYVLYAYKVADVEISGGRIVGDRYTHLSTLGEWGHGVQVRGSNRVTVRDMHISDCWGDGICIGGADVWNGEPIKSNDVVVSNVVSTNNRRQGLSTGRADNVRIYDSEFSFTNGTSPECGIDVEPDEPGEANKVLVQNCRLSNNAKYGMLVYKRGKGVTVRGCTVEKNGSCGIVTVGCSAIYIVACRIQLNSATGIFIQDGTVNCQVSQNTFTSNYTRLGAASRTGFTLVGWDKKVERDILMRGTLSDIRITTNYYR